MVAPTEKTYSVRLNLANLPNAFYASVLPILDRVGLCLHAQRLVPESAHVDLPGVTLNLAGTRSLEHPLEGEALVSLKQNTHAWVLGCGLRDTIELLHFALDEARRLCAFGELAPWRQIRGDHYHAAMKAPRTWARAGLPERFKILRDRYGSDLDVEFAQPVLSINKARGCLVHRLGIVSRQDCNDAERLVVRWRRAQLYAGEGETKRLITPGGDNCVVEAGTVLSMAPWEATERSWRIGEPLVVTTDEFSQMAWTCYGLVSQISQGIEAYLRAKGMEFVAAPAPGP